MECQIDPKTLAKIKDMPLIARTVAEGFLHGNQLSIQRGVGIEFNQYRSYEPGDELSRIDWKLFARSDRYFVREAERESEIDVWFLLDASSSMLQKSESSSGTSLVWNKPDLAWNKLDYAKHMIACFSYLAQKQGDNFGFICLSDNTVHSTNQTFVHSANGESHWRRLLLTLNNIEAGKLFPPIELIKQRLCNISKPSMIFLLSDLNQSNNEITQLLAQINSSKSEVVAMQLSCNSEQNFDYKGTVRFKDLETQEEILLSADNAKVSYLERLHDYQDELHKKLRTIGVFHHQFNIDDAMDIALHNYLIHRGHLA